MGEIEIPDKLRGDSFKFNILGEKSKKPLENEWQKGSNYYYNQKELKDHKGNYGILCKDGLIVIDADTKGMLKICEEKLPKTFAVKTRKGKHFYFICNGFGRKKVLKDGKEHLGEILAEGSFAIAPGSIHPTGVKYEVVNDVEIAEISKEEVDKVFSQYYSKGERIGKEVILGGAKEGLRNETFFRLACSFREQGLNPEDTLLVLQGSNEKSNPPLSQSELQSVVKSAFSYEKKINNIANKIEVKLPKSGRLITEFIEDICETLADKKTIFFRTNSRSVIEITKVKHEDEEEKFTGFVSLKPGRFITLVEKYFIPGHWIATTKDGDVSFEFKAKSMTKELADITLNSQILENALPKIDRIFTIPIPIIYKEKLTFPKVGYDKRFKSWLPPNAPKIIDTEMDLEKSKEVIHNLLKEFCFQSDDDYTIAIAGLITPFLRGLYHSFNCRTPVFIYLGNRERVGKDYLAGISGMIYEGIALEEPPLSSGGNKGNTEEELRKKIMSTFLSGRKRLHFSNNKGFINNGVFEGIVTSTNYSDRVLGKNEVLSFDNELEFSLSGNIGISFTPDLANRSRICRLFYDLEDTNARVFDNPTLHKQVLDNRDLIVSALYSIVRNWIDNDKPEGKLKFASFPEWARVCGGIMESAGYDSPCMLSEEVLSIGGDSETTDMKMLFELCYETKPDEGITKKEIKEIIDGEDIFAYFDFTKMSDQVKFGKKIIKFVGRVLSDIKMSVEDNSVRSSRQKYIFSKKATSGKVGKVGKVDTIVQRSIINVHSIVGNTIPNLPTLPKNDGVYIGNQKTDDKLIHHKCVWCEKTPCVKYDKNGKPVCQECSENPDLDKKEEIIE